MLRLCLCLALLLSVAEFISLVEHFEMKFVKGLTLLSASILLAACGDEPKEAEVVEARPLPPTYNFDSKVTADESNFDSKVTVASSVSYEGSTTRQWLIKDLKTLVSTHGDKTLGDLYDVTQDQAGKEAVLERLNRVYAVGTKTVDDKLDLNYSNVFNNLGGSTPINVSLRVPLTLERELELHSDLLSDINLQSKMAGQENGLTNPFMGWDVYINTEQSDNDRPDLLIQSWFEAIADLAVDGNKDTNFVSSEGLDYQQLIEKVLLGAVTYSQVAGKYFTPTNGGLLAQNSVGDGAKDYTALEHNWDKAFGYFGAQRDYNSVESRIWGTPYSDTNKDKKIDLYAEYSTGFSIYALEVDEESNPRTRTEFSETVHNAFLGGRQLIQDNVGTDPDAAPIKGSNYYADLVNHAQVALNNWENIIAARVVSSLNEYTATMESLTQKATPEEIAKSWSEMKGFALGLQFSPIAQISVEDLTLVHENLGQQPAMGPITKPIYGDDPKLDDKGNAEFDAEGNPIFKVIDPTTIYLNKLAKVRAILQETYGFSDKNLEAW